MPRSLSFPQSFPLSFPLSFRHGVRRLPAARPSVARALVRAASAATAATAATTLALLSAPVAADPARPPRSCAPLPPPADAPKDALDVTAFGARGDDDADDSAALLRALAALKPGQWLRFPPGRYLHDRRLPIRTRGVVLDGRGATLHATHPADMALLVQASGVQILGFTLTARTDRRRAAPWESRIAVWRPQSERLAGPNAGPLSGVVIRGNRLLPSDDAAGGSPHSASSAAIFVSGVRDFLVADNTVVRSLSDGIHVTGGAHDGRVIGNTVRETGDDMIAVVSYLGDGMWTRGQVQELADTLDVRRSDKLVRNVLIADNDVEGQYWGRGISVVGGERVTIRANRIANTAHAAAVYVMREQVYVTFGVRDVRIEGNRIERVQTDAAPFNPLPLPQRLRKTGHGAIEIGARVFTDEIAIAALREALTVERVAVVGNRIERVAASGLRINEGYDERRTRSGERDLGGGRKGDRIERESRGGLVRDVVVRDNRFAQVRGSAINAFGEPAALRLACVANDDSGAPATSALCSDARVTETRGAVVGCGGP
ncbi:MAG: right-handed parallel beta-helix repeat-containing protein [Burkholderiaceae bacterium]|jgi:hypothetical protein|nr:right-handed parallel beta-helix repeat-containing protein [Burkholderiaceae bacterium]